MPDEHNELSGLEWLDAAHDNLERNRHITPHAATNVSEPPVIAGGSDKSFPIWGINEPSMKDTIDHDRLMQEDYDLLKRAPKDGGGSMITLQVLLDHAELSPPCKSRFDLEAAIIEKIPQDWIHQGYDFFMKYRDRQKEKDNWHDDVNDRSLCNHLRERRGPRKEPAELVPNPFLIVPDSLMAPLTPGGEHGHWADPNIRSDEQAAIDRSNYNRLLAAGELDDTSVSAFVGSLRRAHQGNDQGPSRSAR